MAALQRKNQVATDDRNELERLRRQLEAVTAERDRLLAENRVLLATGRYIGERLDDARLDTLFLAMPVSWKGTLVQ